jgi:hypothetical protein
MEQGTSNFAAINRSAETEKEIAVFVPEWLPDQPEKSDPSFGKACSVITVPALYLCAQIFPHEIPAGLLTTVPDPEPDDTTRTSNSRIPVPDIGTIKKLLELMLYGITSPADLGPTDAGLKDTSIEHVAEGASFFPEQWSLRNLKSAAPLDERIASPITRRSSPLFFSTNF